jgi:hypothetical protein
MEGFWTSRHAPETLDREEYKLIGGEQLSNCSFKHDLNGHISHAYIDALANRSIDIPTLSRIVAIPSLCELYWLSLYNTGCLTPQGLQVILASRNLKRLYLQGHRGLTDSSFKSENSRLKELLLVGIPVSNNLFKILRNYSSLELLQVVDGNIESLPMNDLQLIPKLTTFAVNAEVVAASDVSELQPRLRIERIA